MGGILSRLKSLRLNSGFIAFLLIFGILMLVAFPAIDYPLGSGKIVFDGVDLSDLTGGKIPYEFKLSPSLDFYGGSEVAFGVSGNQSDLDSAVIELNRKLSVLDFANYEIYGRQDLQNNTQSIIVRVPKQEAQLNLFNQLIGLSGDVDLQKQVASETSTDQTAQPELVSLNLGRESIEGVEITYTNGSYGFVIDFREEYLNQLLIQGYSDINPDANSRLILSVGGQPLAFQVSQLSSSSTAGRSIFATSFLGDDLNSALLLKDTIVYGNTLSLTAGAVTAVSGRYDQLINWFKLALGLAELLLLISLIVRFKLRGVVLWLQLMFIAAMVMALAKFSILPTTRYGGISFDFQQLPITITGLIGAIIPLGIYVLEVRNYLPYVGIRRILPLDADQYAALRQFSKQQSRRWLRLLAIFAIILAVFGGLGTGTIDIFGQYFIISALAVWVGYTFVIPLTGYLLRAKA